MAGSSMVKGKSSVPARSSSPAHPPTPAPEAAGQAERVQEFLGFGLASESYALPLGSIREILKPPPITPVPRAPAHVPGIISVRGRIITVIDLRIRLRLTAAAAAKRNRILLVDAGEEAMGLLVDHVLQVFRLRDDELEYAAGGEGAEYVIGIGRPRGGRGVGRARDITAPLHRDDDILILLDPMALLKR
jgi:purine-binding chemotaxis protein CheW